MEQKIPGNSDISEKMVNFEWFPKIFESNNPKITVPFELIPNRNLRIFFPHGSPPGKSFRNFRYFRKMENLERLTKIFAMNVREKTVSLDSRPKISEFVSKWIAHLSPPIPWVNPFPRKLGIGFSREKYHIFLDAELALFSLDFTTVGVLNLPRRDWLLQHWACWISQGAIGFYNSKRAESPKERFPFTKVGVGNLQRRYWLLQQWARWISQGEIGFYNCGRAESPKERLAFTTVGVLNLPRSDWLLQQ